MISKIIATCILLIIATSIHCDICVITPDVLKGLIKDKDANKEGTPIFY